MKYLITFLISMVPVIELRGAIPIALAKDIEPWVAFILAVFGNMLPVPFILVFVRSIFNWMKKYERLGRIVTKLEARAESKSESVRKYELVGLCILVAIPLPGTGAWTGALVAALMKCGSAEPCLPSLWVWSLQVWSSPWSVCWGSTH